METTCPVCYSHFVARLDVVSGGSLWHCDNCGYLWNASGTPQNTWDVIGQEVRAAKETRPAQPENCNAPLDYDDRDFAVTLSSRVFAKDIIRGRTDGDVGRRDYKRKQNMDALIASLRR